jgi:hypothetical protein
VIEAGNETTETKIGTGTGTVIRAAGAAAPAAQDGVAPTRDDQACVCSQSIFFLSSCIQRYNSTINADRRDYGRDRDEDKRDRDPRESRRRDERDRRDTGRRDGEKDRDRYDRDKRDTDKGRDAERDDERGGERKARLDSEPRETRKASQSQGAHIFFLLYQLTDIDAIMPGLP